MKIICYWCHVAIFIWPHMKNGRTFCSSACADMVYGPTVNIHWMPKMSNRILMKFMKLAVTKELQKLNTGHD